MREQTVREIEGDRQWSNRTVLVTGASGFLGQALVRELLSAGADVIGTYKSSAPIRESGPNCVRWVRWDALDSAMPIVDWGSLFGIVHMAANTHGRSPTADRESYAAIVESTEAILGAAGQHRVPRLLFVSSGDALAAGDRGFAREDNWTYGPLTFYGACKVAAEVLVSRSGPCPASAVVRVFHPYGLGGDAFLVNRLVGMVRNGEPVTLRGDEGFLVNPVSVTDVAVGLRLALESQGQGVFHLAGGQVLSLGSLAARIGALLGRAPVFRHVEAHSETCHAGGFERSTRELGFVPGVSLDNGLRQLAERV